MPRSAPRSPWESVRENPHYGRTPMRRVHPVTKRSPGLPKRRSPPMRRAARQRRKPARYQADSTRVHKSLCYSRPAAPTAGDWRREPEDQSAKPIGGWTLSAPALSEGVHDTMIVKDVLYAANAATYAAKQRSFCVERFSSLCLQRIILTFVDACVEHPHSRWPMTIVVVAETVPSHSPIGPGPGLGRFHPKSALQPGD